MGALGSGSQLTYRPVLCKPKPEFESAALKKVFKRKKEAPVAWLEPLDRWRWAWVVQQLHWAMLQVRLNP